MAQDTPFGQKVRMRVLQGYFASAGDVTADNAWEHVYRCLLWIADSGEGGQRFRSIADSSPVIADSGSGSGSRR